MPVRNSLLNLPIFPEDVLIRCGSLLPMFGAVALSGAGFLWGFFGCGGVKSFSLLTRSLGRVPHADWSLPHSLCPRTTGTGESNRADRRHV